MNMPNEYQMEVLAAYLGNTGFCLIMLLWALHFISKGFDKGERSNHGFVHNWRRIHNRPPHYR